MRRNDSLDPDHTRHLLDRYDRWRKARVLLMRVIK